MWHFARLLATARACGAAERAQAEARWAAWRGVTYGGECCAAIRILPLDFCPFALIIRLWNCHITKPINEGNMSPQTALTTTTKIDELIANVIADKSFGTATKYDERLRHFAAWLSQSGAPTIDKRAIAAYKKSLVIEGKSASTVNGHL